MNFGACLQDSICLSRRNELLIAQTSRSRDRQQHKAQRLLREELSLRQINDTKAATLSMDGNDQCLLLVTKAGISFALGLCGQEMFAANDHIVKDPLASTRFTSARNQDFRGRQQEHDTAASSETDNSDCHEGAVRQPLIGFHLWASSMAARGWRPVLLSPQQWELLTNQVLSVRDQRARRDALQYLDSEFRL